MSSFEITPEHKAIFDVIEAGTQNAIISAVAGCLAGATVIEVNRAGKSFKLPIGDMVDAVNGGKRGGRIWDPSIPTMVRHRAADGHIRLGRLAAAYRSGTKETLTIETESGRQITATPDHQFFTADGWRKLGDVRVGELLHVDGGAPKKRNTKTKKRPYKTITSGMDSHPFSASRGVRSGTPHRGVPVHRLAYEAAFNNIGLGEYIARIRTNKTTGLWFVDPNVFTVHHIDGDTINNSPENLTLMPRGEHERHHGVDSGWKHVTASSVLERVVMIRESGIRETFDLAMEDEPHNFLANGFVVHNSGKTSTIVQALKLVPMTETVLFLAFSKRIVQELQNRVPSHVQVQTLNSLGHRALVAELKSRGVPSKLDSNKTRSIIRDSMSEVDRPIYSGPVARLVSLAKASAIVPGSGTGLVPDEPASWFGLMDHHGIDLSERADPGTVVSYARSVLRASCKIPDDGSAFLFDFDDQLLMSFALGAPIPTFDRIFVDEAQDLSPLQHRLVARALGQSGRLVAVGDEYQSIFGFRGADSSSMSNLEAHFKCVKLPLHVSYRCPQAVVAEAQQFVPHIKSHPDAAMGIVEHGKKLEDVKLAGGDFVLCRITAPVVKVAYSLLAVGIPAIVLGRDIGQGLLNLIKALDAFDLASLSSRLDAWVDRETAKAMKKDDDAKIASVTDKAETLRVFIEISTSLDDMRSRIEKMFSDDNADEAVTCMTMHKSKGLEADRVFIIETNMGNRRRALKPWQVQQERNLAYVACTRAKKELTYVTMVDGALSIRAQPAAPEAPWVALYGNTFPVKDAMKARFPQRLKWDGDRKVWMAHPDIAGDAQKMINKGARR